MDTNDKLLASKGWLLVDHTGSVSAKHYGLTVREPTVVAVWTSSNVTGAVIDLKKHFGISGASLIDKDPALLIPDEMAYAPMELQLTSGSVNLLRAE